MTNIILPWPGGTPASPWQKLTAYNGRHIRCTATVAQALATGGSPTHPHAVVNFQCGYNDENGAYVLAGVDCSRRHNNHQLASSSCTTGNNNPPFQEFELIYMDAALWEIQERRFPQNAILLSDAIINWAMVQRYTPPDGRLMKIGESPGSQGGQANVGHSVSVALGPSSGTLVNRQGTINQGNRDAYTTSGHSHTGNANSDEKTTMPKRVQTRLYQVIAQTDMALAGVIAFFDGQPSANWSIMSAWDACFIESAHSEANITGNSVHGHTGVGGTSSARSPANRRNPTYPREDGQPLGYYNHTHPWSADLQESNHEPEYVNLVPAKLLETLFPQKLVAGAQLIGPLW